MVNFIPEGAVKPSALEVDSYDNEKAAYRSVAILHGVDSDGNLVTLKSEDGSVNTTMFGLLSQTFKRLFNILQNPPFYQKSTNQIRALVDTNSSMNVVNTVSTLTTLNQLGGVDARYTTNMNIERTAQRLRRMTNWA